MSKATSWISTLWLAGIPLSEVTKKLSEDSYKRIVERHYKHLDEISLKIGDFDFRQLMKRI